MQLPTFEYVVGADAPSLGLFVRENGQLIDLSSGYTYSLKVVDQAGGTVQFTKTSGITGATGSGLPPGGTPNLVIQWATTGELNSLTGGKRYLAQVTITAGADSRQRIKQFQLSMLPAA